MIIFKKNYKTLIKKNFSSDWKYGIKTLYLIILIVFSLISYYHLSKGFVMSPDSYWYSKEADNLIKLNFNLYYLFKNPHVIPSFFYTFPVLLISLSKLLFEVEWQIAFMTFNLILVFFSLILFTNSLLLLKVRPLVISLAIVLLTLSIDLLIWPRYILTDMLFSFLIIFSVYVIIKSIVKEKSYYFLLTLLMILMFFTKPTAPVFIFTTCIFILLIKNQINYTPRFIVLSILGLVIIIPIIFSTLHYLMEIYLINNNQVAFLLKYANKGIVVIARPETFIQPPITFVDNLYLYFIKIIIFFKPYAAKYSMIHTILNTFHTFLIIFSIIIWSYLNESIKSINETFLFILLMSLMVSAYHSFTIIDYDWRYRFPLILPLIMLFPISIEMLLRKANIR
ncbi:hypothetical protein N9I48_01435 [Candidatus Pelagibacter sp.]|jgi:hypothetical protein|nr:hypothetical protein [Candidatus Pelagibacter sp.]|tara:strand:- start:494 stop:1678 length:1185 start_codon:yes stop_codon:yes gene_type:complete